MRCNACWRELDGRAVTTTCGHLLCTEDATKILSNDGACPICDQVLSKSLMKPIDINPSDEWTNMAVAGISPQISYQKMAKRNHMLEQENESLSKDNKELQEKISEKSRGLSHCHALQLKSYVFY